MNIMSRSYDLIDYKNKSEFSTFTAVASLMISCTGTILALSISKLFEKEHLNKILFIILFPEAIHNMNKLLN